MRYYLEKILLSDGNSLNSIRRFAGKPALPDVKKGEVTMSGRETTGKVEFVEILTLQELTEAIEKTPYSYF